MGEYAKIVRIRPYLFQILFYSARDVEDAGPYTPFNPPRSGTIIIHSSVLSFQYSLQRAVEDAGPCRFFDPPRSGTAILHSSVFSFQYSLRRGRFVKRPYNAAFVPSVSSML